jgi:hypothetical protein
LRHLVPSTALLPVLLAGLQQKYTGSVQINHPEKRSTCALFMDENSSSLMMTLARASYL